VSAYTPGPWVASWITAECPFPAGPPQSVQREGTIDGQGRICDMVAQGHGKYDPAVTAANARLIAAAPELLAVAQGLVAYHTGEGLRQRTGGLAGCSNCGGVPHSATCHVGLALAAIAKAVAR
jgi:hypothetical protein